MSWESSSGTWKFYKDGGLTDQGTLKRGYTIRQGGTLAFGQEQDSVGGRFEVSQSFQGKLSGVNVWDHVLTSNKIKEMSTTCVLNEEDNGNVYNWVDILREGAIRLVEPSTCEPMGKGMCGFKISTYNITKYSNLMLLLLLLLLLVCKARDLSKNKYETTMASYGLHFLEISMLETCHNVYYCLNEHSSDHSRDANMPIKETWSHGSLTSYFKPKTVRSTSYVTFEKQCEKRTMYTNVLII